MLGKAGSFVPRLHAKELPAALSPGQTVPANSPKSWTVATPGTAGLEPSAAPDEEPSEQADASEPAGPSAAIAAAVEGEESGEPGKRELEDEHAKPSAANIDVQGNRIFVLPFPTYTAPAFSKGRIAPRHRRPFTCAPSPLRLLVVGRSPRVHFAATIAERDATGSARS
jgi:hypothetical protein